MFSSCCKNIGVREPHNPTSIMAPPRKPCPVGIPGDLWNVCQTLGIRCTPPGYFSPKIKLSWYKTPLALDKQIIIINLLQQARIFFAHKTTKMYPEKFMLLLISNALKKIYPEAKSAQIKTLPEHFLSLVRPESNNGFSENANLLLGFLHTQLNIDPASYKKLKSSSIMLAEITTQNKKIVALERTVTHIRALNRFNVSQQYAPDQLNSLSFTRFKSFKEFMATEMETQKINFRTQAIDGINFVTRRKIVTHMENVSNYFEHIITAEKCNFIRDNFIRTGILLNPQANRDVAFDDTPIAATWNVLNNKHKIFENHFQECLKQKIGDASTLVYTLYASLLFDPSLSTEFKDSLQIMTLAPPDEHMVLKSGDIIMDPWFAHLDLDKHEGYRNYDIRNRENTVIARNLAITKKLYSPSTYYTNHIDPDKGQYYHTRGFLGRTDEYTRFVEAHIPGARYTYLSSYSKHGLIELPAEELTHITQVATSHGVMEYLPLINKC